jgi:hypothetical protein
MAGLGSQRVKLYIMKAEDIQGIVVTFPTEARHFSLLHSIQAGCEAYLEFYPTGPRGVLSSGVKK